MRFLLCALTITACCLASSSILSAEKISSRNADISPRRPALPESAPGSHLTNPIDLILQPYFTAHKILPAAVVDDRTYARRVYLDVVGILPTPEELAAFRTDSKPNKRERLVQKLLADRHRYAEHWLTFWNDLLRNDYRGTGYIDGGRKQITSFLYESLYRNKPFDKFVSELISPTPESEGFVKGIVWRGVVNASQVPPVQAAQNISQVFLGINLKCASCHDSFVNDWKLKDAYAFAGIFSETPLEMHHCDKPTGQFAPVAILYPQLGSIDAKAPRAERLKQLAAVITSPKNGRLRRTMVNRLWAKLLGRGLVEPVDDMDAAPWNKDLLDWLAADLGEHHDLQKTLQLILTSRAYQLPAMRLAKPPEGDFVFSGPLVRRMTAEQFVDAMSSLTGVSYTSPGVRGWAISRVPLKWVWGKKNTFLATVAIRKTFELDKPPLSGRMIFSTSNRGQLWLNGKLVEGQSKKDGIEVADIAPLLRRGKNVIAGDFVNDGTSSIAAIPNLLVHVRIVLPGDPHGDTALRVVEIGTDQSWQWTDKPPADWKTITKDKSAEQQAAEKKLWKPVIEVDEADRGPGQSLAPTLISALVYGDTSHDSFRSALVVADPLLVALGRPNREQVVTDRPQLATTLQALELTNGSTLANQLSAGARKWLDQNRLSSDELVQSLYQKALGRRANDLELKTAREILGTPVTAGGLEDLLWIITMLPEFQLVY